MAQLKYTKELLQEAVDNSFCMSDVCRYLGKFPRGATWTLIKRKIQQFEIDTSHFLGCAAHAGSRNTGSARKHTPEEVLVAGKKDRERPYRLRRALLESGRDHRCEGCDLGDEWKGKKLILEIDHKNGDWSDCRKENLRFLCPNCHSQVTNNEE